jgi:hypothetical protein
MADKGHGAVDNKGRRFSVGDTQMHRERRTRNWVVLGLLLAFIVLVYAVAIVRMSGG